ncbi:MAG: C45 family autoproteolytic acyltransferase/hydrolase [Robiginitalea sp.]
MKQIATLMKIITPSIAVFIVMALLVAGCKQEASKDNADPEKLAQPTSAASVAGIKEVVLSGFGYELGFQHGKALKTEIAEIVTKWKENTAATLKRDPDSVLADFYAYAQFEEAIKTYTPELYQEIRGIAEGSGQDFYDILILNLLDEFWVYIDNPENHHCSNVGVPAQNGNPGYIAQNMDIEAYTDGYQTLIRVQRTDTHPEKLILTHPGLIALNGMNEEGIGVVVNTIMELLSAPDGLPVACIVRKILDQKNEEELLDFVKTAPHASGQNYILGIRGNVYDFEASANRVVAFNPNNQNGTIYHTNHPIVNSDLKPWHSIYNPSQAAEDLPVLSNSYVRLAALEKRFASSIEISDVNIMGALRSKDDPDNPVCRNLTPGLGGFTFASVIMTFSATPSLQVTSGPPDESEYAEYYFESD